MQRSEIITVERRRRWSLADKRRLVAETLEPGASVCAVARRYGVHASQLFAWRKAAREGALQDEPNTFAIGPAFTPVVVQAEPAAPPAIAAEPSTTPVCVDAGRIEIVLRGGYRVIVDAAVEASALSRVLDVLERR